MVFAGFAVERDAGRRRRCDCSESAESIDVRQKIATGADVDPVISDPNFFADYRADCFRPNSRRPRKRSAQSELESVHALFSFAVSEKSELPRNAIK